MGERRSQASAGKHHGLGRAACTLESGGRLEASRNHPSPLQPANSHTLRPARPQVQSHIYALPCRLPSPAHPCPPPPTLAAEGSPHSPLLVFPLWPHSSLQTLELILPLHLPQIRGAAPLCASKGLRRKPWKAAGFLAAEVGRAAGGAGAETQEWGGVPAQLSREGPGQRACWRAALSRFHACWD